MTSKNISLMLRYSMRCFNLIHFCRLSAVIAIVVHHISNSVIADSLNVTEILDRPERSPSLPTFTIIDDQAGLFQEVAGANGTRKVGRSLSSNARSQRSSSFRLEDNGSKLHYLRNTQLELAGARSDFNSAEANSLFCYHQTAHADADLSPTVTRCNQQSHDACMLLENIRTAAREMSCISAADCELTRQELFRAKADGSVRLTCCQSNLCNNPAPAKPKASLSQVSLIEKPRQHQQQQKADQQRQRTANLQDRHPLMRESLGIQDMFAPHSRQMQQATDPASTLLQPAARNSRGSNGRQLFTSSNLRNAASLLDRNRASVAKTRPSSSETWQTGLSAGQINENQPEMTDSNSISAMISRVLNGGSSRGQNPSKQALSSHSKNSRQSNIAEMIQQRKHQQQSSFQSSSGNSDQDLYQQMMLLLGGAHEVGSSKSGSTDQQQQASKQRTTEAQSFGLLAANVCDFPPLMPNAWVSVASLEVGSEVYYQCSAGYQLEGPRVVTCTEQLSGTTSSPYDGKMMNSQPRWTQVPSCVRAPENQLGDKISLSPSMSENDIASQIMNRAGNNNNNNNGMAGNIKTKSVDSEALMPGLEIGESGSSLQGTEDAMEVASNVVEENREISTSDRVTQCYDNRAGSVFVASCRGESVICTRIVTTGASAMSLLSSSESAGGPLNSDSPALAEGGSVGQSRSGSSAGQQQQVSQYCALLDDCLRFERWVRLANREDIDVLCCSTDLCNA